MRLFEEPIVEVQKFAVEDVITTSSVAPTAEDQLPTADPGSIWG